MVDRKAQALIIGVEYTNYARQNSDDRLPGCHNDARTMQGILRRKYGVSYRNMTVLMDDGRHGAPTRQNILRQIHRLINSGKKRLWLTFSGHGTYMSDSGRDEKDGKDEALVPADYRTSGMIKDDEIRNYLLRIPKGVQFTAIYDCCHSGTMSDLPTSFMASRPARAQKLAIGTFHPKRQSQLISLSACMDAQYSYSVYNLANRKKWRGLLTYCFSKLKKRYLPGNILLKFIQKEINRRGIPQLTTLSTNKAYGHSRQVKFPFVR